MPSKSGPPMKPTPGNRHRNERTDPQNIAPLHSISTTEPELGRTNADFEKGLTAMHKKALGIHEPKGTKTQKANLARDRACDIFIKHKVTTKT